MRLHPLLAAAAFFLAASVSATQVQAPNALGGLVETHTAAGKQTVTIGGIDFDNRGRPLDARGIPTLETDGAASSKTTNTGSLKNPSGNPVPVTATGRIPPATAGKAIGKFLFRIAPTGYVLNTGVALYDLAKELGFNLERNPDGSIKVEQSDPDVCSTAPCYGYIANAIPAPRPIHSTSMAACLSQKDSLGLGGTVTVATAADTYCTFYSTSYGYYTYTGGISKVSIAPKPPSYTPSTPQAFLDAVAAKSGWPSTSNLARTLEEAAKVTGEKLKPESLTVSGPATSPGTTSQTQKANGSTETKTTTHNHTYNGNTVTTTNTTVITNYNPTTNITTTETTTETPPKEEDQPEYEATDTPLPDQPKLYEPKYPQGPSKVWADRKADFLSSPLLQLTTALSPNIPAAGCPQFSVALDLAVVNFGTYNVGPPCYVWDFCKVVILISALFLARALIFGG